jgi:DNA polymerase-2
MARVDPDLVAKAKAIKSEHKALGVVCFGYFRYRNARFGCAEVHQAIQCLGRAGMTRAREVAQREGYELVHAITDCVFLQKKGIKRMDAVRIARKITDEVEVPMDVEGVYKWLVLLPSKTHSLPGAGHGSSDLGEGRGVVGVPNRYYGKFEDGTLKVRGIEVQRHSTPPFLYDAQQGMLEVFLEADDAAGFRARIPRALEVLRLAAVRLRKREVSAEDLGLMVQARMEVEEYSANTGTKAALRLLRDEGTERKPGEYVKYVVTRRTGPWAGRVLPVELLGKGTRWFPHDKETYHVDSYIRLLARQAETLLSPFGFTEQYLYDWLAGRSLKAQTLDAPGSYRERMPWLASHSLT